MYHLTTLIPATKKLRWPLTRDQLMMLMMAVNLIFLGVDIYLAHNISGTIVPNEWTPIIFGFVGGGILLGAGLIALKHRPLASLLATLTLLVSIGVGLLGAYFHLVRAILPTGPAGQQISIDLLVWAPPILGPLMFSMVGIMGLSAAWPEIPADSGLLVMPGNRKLLLPYAKTQAYFYIVGMGALATVISSVLDHGRLSFDNLWVWLPTGVGVFATVVAVILGATNRPTRSDLWTYTVAMLLMIAVGVGGAWLHIESDLTTQGRFVAERFIRGAPILAPLLFANIGTLGLIVLLNPREE